jgi:hypothetical protein
MNGLYIHGMVWNQQLRSHEQLADPAGCQSPGSHRPRTAAGRAGQQARVGEVNVELKPQDFTTERARRRRNRIEFGSIERGEWADRGQVRYTSTLLASVKAIVNLLVEPTTTPKVAP